MQCIKADILDHVTLSKLLQGIDIVIHLAADTSVVDSIADPVKNFDINVAGTFHLLRLSRDAGVSIFIQASTGGAILGEALSPVNENMVAQPLSPYGASKLAAEGYCSAFSAAYGMQTISLRFSNVYGPWSYHKDNAISNFLKRLLKHEELIVYGNGEQIRDYVFVGDLVKGIHAIMAKPVSGVFQLASGQPTTLNQLIACISKVVGQEEMIKIRYRPARSGEVYATWCCIEKASKEYHFSPTTSLEQGLSITWQWFKAFESANRPLPVSSHQSLAPRRRGMGVS